MPGDVQRNEPKGETGVTGDELTREELSEALDKAHYNALLTLRIEREPLLLSDVAAIFTSITHLYTKLNVISYQGRLHGSRSLLEYLTEHDPLKDRVANLAVTSMTTNSPLTVVLVVSEALGRALSSLIDAVSQARLRYEKAKQELEQSRVAVNLQHIRIRQELQQQSDEHEMAMRERLIHLQGQLLDLDTRQLLDADREEQIGIEMEIKRNLREEGFEVLVHLHPGASSESKEMMVQALMDDLLELFHRGTGLVSESVTPRNSA